MGHKEDCCIGHIPFWWVFNPILCYLSPKILIFQEPLIIETWNLHHWIWHASNPKYMPLKPFQCILPSQNQQDVKFLPEILIFQKLLIVRTQNLHHWIWHASHPTYAPLKPFQHIFPSQNQPNVKFLAVSWTPLDKKWKNVNLYREKSVQKGLKICTCRFSGMPIAIHYVRTLCDKSFLSYDGFSCCSFIENTSVKQSMKHKVCSNFETSFLHLGQMDPPVEASSGREQY